MTDLDTAREQLGILIGSLTDDHLREHAQIALDSLAAPQDDREAESKPRGRSLVCSIAEHGKCDGNAPNGLAGVGNPCACACHAATLARTREPAGEGTE